MTQSSQKVQTSVEWFMEKLYHQGFLKEVEYVPTILINEAKERYNIELGNAYQQGWKDAVDYTYNNHDYHTIGELYYNETYKND